MAGKSLEQLALQWVKPLWVACRVFVPIHRKLLPVTTTTSTRCKGQGARCKGQDQHQRKSEQDAATTCNSNHHHSFHALPLMRQGMKGIRSVCPYASCNDCCIVHSTSAGADPELVSGGGGGWNCMLLLHPVPTCADSDLCTLHPDLCTLCLRW